jgi:osmotically-inducible protein OsmY
MPATRRAVVLALAAACLASGCAPLVVGTAAVGGTAVALDRRHTDVQLTDERLEWTVSRRIIDKVKDKAYIGVTSYNQQVLLTGQASTEELKKEAEAATAALPEVKAVVNEVQVGPTASFASRANDTYLTSAVKSRFVGDQKFNPVHVKVVTEAGVVYLMGIVTRKEADEASHIARHVSGVKRVVRIFEYLPDPPPKPPGEAAPKGPPPPPK